MDASPAAGSAERHLVFLQVVVVDTLLELAEKKVMGDEVRLGKAGGIDGLDASEVVEVALVAGGGSGQRIVAELVVVAIVADGGPQEGHHLEGGLPGIVEEGVLGGNARSDRGGRLSDGDCRCSSQTENGGSEQVGAHAQ